MTMALVQGTTTEKFDVLRENLEASLANGDDVGASIAVFHHEELVCDLWGGYRDAAKTVPRDRLCGVAVATPKIAHRLLVMKDRDGRADVVAVRETRFEVLSKDVELLCRCSLNECHCHPTC